MSPLPMIDKKNLGKFGSYTLVTGVLLTVLGTVAIFLPGMMSMATDIFAAWLLLIGGVFWAIHTYRYDSKCAMSWLKPTLLVGIGLFMLLSPVSGVAVMGMLLAIYLLLDAFSSFSIARSIHPAKGWGWMTCNGVISFLLATLFLLGWPATSMWLVGLYVGISLLFDGCALLAIGWAFRKAKSS